MSSACRCGRTTSDECLAPVSLRSQDVVSTKLKERTGAQRSHNYSITALLLRGVKRGISFGDKLQLSAAGLRDRCDAERNGDCQPGSSRPFIDPTANLFRLRCCISQRAVGQNDGKLFPTISTGYIETPEAREDSRSYLP